MSDSLGTVAGDLRRRPLAFLAVLATFLVPAAFAFASTFVSGLGPLLIPFGLLALALVAQVGRLATAPATAVAEALLAGATPREAAAAARAGAADRVVAAAVERTLVVVGTVLVGSAVVCVALALATVGGFALAAAGIDAPQESYAVLLLAILGVLGVGAGVGAPLRLGTTLAGDVSPTRAPMAALPLARGRPVATTLLVVLRVVPWATFLLAAAAGLFLPTDLPIPIALVGTAVVLAVAGTALAVGLERRMVAAAPPPGGPSTVSDPPAVASVLPNGRVLVAAVVVLAAVAAPTLAVRVGDTRPTMATTNAVSDGTTASSVVAAANRRTRATPHYENATTWGYNETTGRMERRMAFDYGWDPADEQALLEPDVPTDAPVPGMGTQFYGDGTVAFAYDVSPSGPVVALATRETGRWTVVAVPGKRFGMSTGPDVESRLRGVDRDAVPWRVLSRANGTVVVGVERPSRLAPAFGVPAGNVSADSHVRLTVDADTGRPLVLDVHRNVTEWGEHRQVRSTVRYREWGSYDLERPAPLGRPSPLELFWDALAY